MVIALRSETPTRDFSHSRRSGKKLRNCAAAASRFRVPRAPTPAFREALPDRRPRSSAPRAAMGRCPTGGGKKTSSQKNRVGYATKRLRRSRFELPHADVIYKAVHGHLKTGGNAKKPGAARELSSMEAMIKGDPNQPFNEDLPGGGQFYDMFTGRHFESEEALERHMKTKQYKRDKKRVLNGPAPHEQRDAEAAAGMGAPDNGKKRTHRAIAKDIVME